jgi:hypothetical protein
MTRADILSALAELPALLAVIAGVAVPVYLLCWGCAA